MGYVTIDQLKSSLELTGETYADADVTLAISAASAAIDAQCQRKFTLDADNTSVRVYRVYSPQLVDVDDIVDVQGVAVGYGDGTYGTTLTEHATYELSPLNAPADGEPWTMIRLLGRQCSSGYGNRARVQVTGQFGWPAVPDLVEGACTLLAGRYLKRFREAPFGIVGVGLEGQVARIAQSDPDVCGMLGPVTRILVR